MVFKKLGELKKKIFGEKGQGMVEYALIIAFVVGVAVYITQSGTLGEQISGTFDDAVNQLSSSRAAK